MNKEKLFLIFALIYLMPMLSRGQGTWFSADSANFKFTCMADVKNAAKKWHRSWIPTDSSNTQYLANERELDSVLILPYFRVFPDTLCKTLCHEYRREKIVMVPSGKRVYYWYLKPTKGFNQLAVGSIIPDEFRLMLSKVSKKKNLHLVYFIEGECFEIPPYSRNGNLSMMLGYTENGHDFFLDEKLNIYNSVDDAINARYEGMDGYIMYYRQGFVNKLEFVR